MHTLYDLGSTVSLVRNDVAMEVWLQPPRTSRRAVRGFKGKVEIIDSCYYLPLLDADGDI
jgi:hypothetical protein